MESGDPRQGGRSMPCAEVKDLLLRCADRDERAFDSLYARTAGLIRKILRRKLDHRTEVEDALQEVFTRVWTGASGFDPARGSALTWIATIAGNFAIDQRRMRRIIASGDFETAQFPCPDRSTEDRLDDQTLARIILSALGDLDPKHAHSIKAVYLGGHSYRDLADAHGVPLNTMRTWLRRGLTGLQESVSFRLGEHETATHPQKKSPLSPVQKE